MKVAIVHDYLNQLGGAERVVGVLHQLFPQAPVFTSIVDRNRLWPSLVDADIRTSWMQSLPGLQRHFKKYLPFYPIAMESFDLQEYDLVISSSSAFAKGVRTRKDAIHFCYCHTPMRFVWDYDRYVEREQFGQITRTFLPMLIDRLKAWDLRTAGNPTRYIANSSVVADRIRRYYGKEPTIIFPPVEIDRFSFAASKGDYFLLVSRLNPYKRIDLAIEAFNDLGLPLRIVGDGPDRPILERMAKPNIQFLGRRPDEEVARFYAECRGFVFPGEEDFGITPLEANAAGSPVIAYQAGGALDTVVDEESGIFFKEQTVAALKQAVLRCDSHFWDRDRLRQNAMRFSPAVFSESLRSLLAQYGAQEFLTKRVLT